MERTPLTQKEFNKEVERVAREVKKEFLKMGTFWPISMCRPEARKLVAKAHWIVPHDGYKKLREREFLVERAVEMGQSSIVYEGHQISIM